MNYKLKQKRVIVPVLTAVFIVVLVSFVSIKKGNGPDLIAICSKIFKRGDEISLDFKNAKRNREQLVVQYKDSRLERLFTKRFAPEAKSADFSEFLAICGETPESLSLVALATRDPSILMKLEEKASSPIACQVLFMRSGSSIDKLRWADSMIACDSKNLMGYLYKAGALFKLGEKEKGLLAFKQGSGLQPIDRLSTAFAFGLNEAQTIPQERALEIVYADSKSWAQEAVRPALESVSRSLQINESLGGITAQELANASDLLNQIVEASDPRFKSRVQGMVQLERLKVAGYLDSNVTTKKMLSSWGTAASVENQLDVGLQEESDSDQRLLAPMDRQNVNLHTLEWLTKKNSEIR